MRRSPVQIRLPAPFGLLAQLVEHLTVNQVVVSSSLTAGVIEILIGISFANLAQLVEHLPRKEKVVGSTPIIGTISTSPNVRIHP